VFAGYGMGRVGRGSVRDRGPLTMADTLVGVNAGAWPDRKRDHVSANAENEDVTRTTSPPPERLTGTPFSLPCTISARLRYLFALLSTLRASAFIFWPPSLWVEKGTRSLLSRTTWHLFLFSISLCNSAHP